MQSIVRHDSHTTASNASLRQAQDSVNESIQERLDRQNQLFNDTWGWNDIIHKSPPSFVLTYTLPRVSDTDGSEREDLPLRASSIARATRDKLADLFLTCFGKRDDSSFI